MLSIILRMIKGGDISFLIVEFLFLQPLRIVYTVLYTMRVLYGKILKKTKKPHEVMYATFLYTVGVIFIGEETEENHQPVT